MPLTYSRHHIIYEGKDYKTPSERQLRRHRALIVPLFNEVHLAQYPESLHRETKAPIKPQPRHIIGALSLLDGLRDCVLMNPSQVIPHLADYFDRVNEPMGLNLRQQLPYIERGIVRGGTRINI